MPIGASAGGGGGGRAFQRPRSVAAPIIDLDQAQSLTRRGDLIYELAPDFAEANPEGVQALISDLTVSDTELGASVAQIAGLDDIDTVMQTLEQLEGRDRLSFWQGLNPEHRTLLRYFGVTPPIDTDDRGGIRLGPLGWVIDQAQRIPVLPGFGGVPGEGGDGFEIAADSTSPFVTTADRIVNAPFDAARAGLGGALATMDFLGDRADHVMRMGQALQDQGMGFQGAGAVGFFQVDTGAALLEGVLRGKIGEVWSDQWDRNDAFLPSAQREVLDLFGGDRMKADLARAVAAGGSLATVVEDYWGFQPGTPEFQDRARQLLELQAQPTWKEAIETLGRNRTGFGQDRARDVGLDPSSGFGLFVAGGTQLAFDVVMDPTLAAGKGLKVYRGLTALRGRHFLTDVDEAQRLSQVAAKADGKLPAGWNPDEIGDVAWARAATAERLAANNPFSEVLVSEARSLKKGRAINAAFERVARAFGPDPEYSHWDLVRDLPHFEGALPDMIRFDQAARSLGQRGLDDIDRVWDFFRESDMTSRHLMSKVTGYGQDAQMPGLTPNKVRWLDVKGWWHRNVFDPAGRIDQRVLDDLEEMGRAFDESYDVDAFAGARAAVAGGRRGGIARTKVSRFAAGFTQQVPRGGHLLRHAADGARAEAGALEDFHRFLSFGNLTDIPEARRAQYYDRFLRGTEAERGVVIKSYLTEIIGRSGLADDPDVLDVFNRFVKGVDQAYGSDVLTDGMKARSLELRAGVFATQSESITAIPDFKELARVLSYNRLGRMVGGRQLVTGYRALDNVIQRAWKPMQLMRIGFITRAAGEELISFALRLGPMAYLKAKVGADWALDLRRHPVTGELLGREQLSPMGRRWLAATNTIAGWAGVDEPHLNQKALDLWKRTAPTEFAKAEKAGITSEQLARWVEDVRTAETGLSSAVRRLNDASVEAVARWSPAFHHLMVSRVGLPSRKQLVEKMTGVQTWAQLDESGRQVRTLSFSPVRRDADGAARFSDRQQGQIRLVSAYQMAMHDPMVRRAYAEPITGSYRQYGDQSGGERTLTGPNTSRRNDPLSIRVPLRSRRKGTKWELLDMATPEAQAQYFSNVALAMDDATVAKSGAIDVLASYLGSADLADLARVFAPTEALAGAGARAARSTSSRTEARALLDEAEAAFAAGDFDLADELTAASIERTSEADLLDTMFDASPDGLVRSLNEARDDLVQHLGNDEVVAGLTQWLDFEDVEALDRVIQALPPGPASDTLSEIRRQHAYIGAGTRNLFWPREDWLRRPLSTDRNQVRRNVADRIYQAMLEPGNQPTTQSLYRAAYTAGQPLARPPLAGHVRLYSVHMSADDLARMAILADDPNPERLRAFARSIRDELRAKGYADGHLGQIQGLLSGNDANPELALRRNEWLRSDRAGREAGNLPLAFTDPEVADVVARHIDELLNDVDVPSWVTSTEGRARPVKPLISFVDTPEAALDEGLSTWYRGQRQNVAPGAWRGRVAFDTTFAPHVSGHATPIPDDARGVLVETIDDAGTTRWRAAEEPLHPGERPTGNEQWSAGITEHAAVRQLAQDRADEVVKLLTTFDRPDRPDRTLREFLGPALNGTLSTGFDSTKTPLADLPRVINGVKHDLEPDRISFAKIAGSWFSDVVTPAIDSIIRTPHFVHNFARTLESADQMYGLMVRGKLNDEVVGTIGENTAATLAPNVHWWWDKLDDLDEATWMAEMAEDPMAAFLYAVKRHDKRRALQFLAQIDATDALGRAQAGAAGATAARARAQRSVDDFPTTHTVAPGTSDAETARVRRRQEDARQRNLAAAEREEGAAATRVTAAARAIRPGDEATVFDVGALAEFIIDPKKWKDRTLERWMGRVHTAHAESIKSATLHAVDRTVPFIDDHRIRSQFSEHMSGLMPFWHAEEQFLKRQARMVWQTPEALRKAQHYMDGMRHVGLIREDAEGNEIFVYPATQQLNALTLGALGRITGLGHLEVLAQPMTADVDYLFPGYSGEKMTGSFGVGPLVGFGLAKLTDFFPELASMEQAALDERGIDRDPLEYFIPSSVMTLLGAAAPDVFRKDRMMSASSRAIQALAANGMVPDEDATPDELDAFHDQVRGLTRSMAIIDGLFSFSSPLPSGTRVELSNLEWSNEWNELMDLGLPFDEVAKEFVRRHPNATPYTVFATESASGASMARTAEAYQFIMDNAGMLETLPMAATWLMPQPTVADEFDRRAQNEIMRRELRERRTPEDYLRELYIADAAPRFFDMTERFDHQIVAARLRGDHAEARFLTDERALQVQAFMRQHPTFADSYQGGEGRERRKEVLAQSRTLLQLADDGQLPEGEHIDDVLGLMRGWVEFTDRYQAMRGRRDAGARETRAVLAEDFLLWAERYVDGYPGARSFYDSVVRWDSNLGGLQKRIELGLEETA